MKKWIISILAFASIIGFMTANADVAKADNSTTVIEQMIDSNGFGFSVRSDRQQTHSDTSILNINEFWARDVCVCEYYALNAPLAYPTHLAFPMYYITPPIKEDADIISYGARHLVTKIADQAFENCDYISGITIPNSVDTIGARAFYNCNNITEIVIPDSVDKIEYQAFANCSNLTKVTILSSHIEIAQGAFYKCSNLKSVEFPDSVKSGIIGADAFEDCKSLTSITIPEGVTSIGSSAFSGCTNLASASIPEGVTSIGNDAFNNCANLTDIIIPSTLTSIGEGAFHYCTSLTSVSIPEGVTCLASDTFAGCESLTDITIPSTLTSIGDYAFHGCASLTSVSIPKGVNSIGEGAFVACVSLASMTIPEGVTCIEDSTFAQCEKLTSIIIPSTVISIEAEAFHNCYGLTSVTIPEGVTCIGSDTFAGCESLTDITIPSTLTSIGEEAFWDSGLTSIKVEPGNTKYDSRDNCNAIIDKESNTLLKGCNTTSVSIPYSVIGIGNMAFWGCKNIKSVTIPNSVTNIEGMAFAFCTSLKSITIPSTVTNIEDDAFLGAPDGFIIYGDAGTAAEAYAKENKLTFRPIPKDEPSQDPKPDAPAANNGISCKQREYKIVYGAKPFTINAVSNSRLTYESSSTKIASVDQQGKVTIKGTGTAAITIKTASSSIIVTVKVSPKKQKVKSAKPAKGKKLTVKWTKDKNASGYQVQISTSKSFKKNAKETNMKKYSKTSSTFKKLKAGKKYYVRVRSYKRTGKSALYGAWSTPKQSKKIKK